MNNNNNTMPVYFFGLNEIRAIAALLVLIHHIEQYKSIVGDANHYKGIIEMMGFKAVDVFFTLSGFLITYLLLDELKINDKICIKKFYIRRMLRIWPLYFFVFILSLVIFPLLQHHIFFIYEKNFDAHIYRNDYNILIPLYLFFLSNIALIIRMPLMGAAYSWSVSVEEWFYLFWPWVIQKFRNNLLIFFIAFIGSKLVIGKILLILSTKVYPQSDMIRFTHDVWASFRFEMMAIGAIGALIIDNHKLKGLHRLLSKRIALAIALSLSVFSFSVDMNYSISGIIYMILILSFIFNKVQIKYLNYLGKISFGLYMYQMFAIYLVFAVLHNLGIKFDTVLGIAVSYSCIFAALVFTSYFSFRFVESPFLTRKKRFEIVKTKN